MIRNKKFANSVVFDVGASGSVEKNPKNASTIQDSTRVTRRENLVLSQKSQKLSSIVDEYPKSNLQTPTNSEMDVDSADIETILTYPSSSKKHKAVRKYQKNSVSEEKSREKVNNEILLNRLRGIKRQRYSNFELTLGSDRSRNDEISIDEFDKSVRALDVACKSQQPTSQQKKEPPIRLGLLSFGVFENLTCQDVKNSSNNKKTSVHLSFDEDNEEDMFDEAKDEVEDIVEFDNWDDKNDEKFASFHGFTSTESQHSNNIATRCSQREKLENLDIRESEEEPFHGYSFDDIKTSVKIKNTWHCRLNNYERDFAIDTSMEISRENDRSCVEKDKIIFPRIRELQNMELSKSNDKKLKKSRIIDTTRKSRSLPSKSIERNDDVFSDNCKIEYSPKYVSSMSLDTGDSRGFSTASGRKIVVSEMAITKAQKMYKDINDAITKNPVIDVNEDMKNENIGKTRDEEFQSSKESSSMAKAQLNEIEDDIIVSLKNEPDFTIDDELSEQITQPNTLIIKEEIKKDFDLKNPRDDELMMTKESSLKAEAQQDKIKIESNERPVEKNLHSTGTETRKDFDIGFKTAGGRKLKISKEALSKAKAQFNEIQDDIIVSLKNEPNFTIDDELSKKITQPNTSIIKEEIKQDFDLKNPRDCDSTITRESLSKARAQYEQIQIELSEKPVEKNLHSTHTETKMDFDFGFTTAGGRKLKISKEALSKAETRFNEIEQELNDRVTIKTPQNDIKEKKNETSLGFTTAGGGKFKISKESLSKAKAQFNEINDNNESSMIADINHRICATEKKKDSTIGFTTAGGRELNISKKALLLAKDRFVDIENEFGDNSLVPSPEFNCLVADVSSTSFAQHKINDSAADFSTRVTLIEENLPIDACNLESLEFDDFSMDQSDETMKKRKSNDIDDDTPIRRDPPWKRKKGRYMSDDCQGRKLFDEKNESIALTREPEINQITEDIDASAAALIEDEEFSREITKSQCNVTCDVKIQMEIGENSKNLCERHEPEINDNENFSKPLNLIIGSAGKIAKTNDVNDVEEMKIGEIQTESIPDDLSFDSQFSQDLHQSQVIDKFIIETMKIVEARMAMTLKQDETIRTKRRNKPLACDGSLYFTRLSKRNERFTWQQLTDGEAPRSRECNGKFVDNEILGITANSAGSYNFCCADFYGGKNVRINVEGIKVGDGAFLILDERNCAGAREFERGFLASPGVDPNLVPTGWLKNHYRWIVWKLASMDRVQFGHKLLPRMLTPNRVMLELKYRYDREIYRMQWSPIRRILEKNEDAAARLVLCVAGLTEEDDKKTPVKGSSITPSALGSTIYRMKLTDGWYCINATIDTAMVNCIKSGKVKEGTKLVTFGAKAMNVDQGCSVLEIPGDVTLRIHTNSTRRVKWDTKLDFCHPNRGPMSLSLKSIKSNGGAICKLIVAVARLYPILYREKLPDGQFVFRNARCDEEAARAHEARCQSKMEEICENARNDFQLGSEGTNHEEEIRQNIATMLRECLPPPRDVTPVLKIRIAEGETSAMMTIWSTDRETDQVFQEGSSVMIYNCFASGQRYNELQITAGRNTIFNREISQRITHPERIFTSLMDIGESGFNPVYGEFDTVGIVSSIGPAPHGMKNFETINLACPRFENSVTSDFLSILFWQGVSTHGYSRILTVGTLIACCNLEWRRNTSRSIPTAYCTERSIFTKNPRHKHLAKPFESLRELIKDPLAYAATSAITIQDEIAKKTSLRTPGSSTTPYRGTTLYNTTATTPVWNPRCETGSTNDANCITPRNNSKKASIMRRIEKLEVYGEPPKLPLYVNNDNSPNVSSDFRTLKFTPTTKSS